MGEPVTVEINIETKKVTFRVDGKDFEGKPDFSKKALGSLLAQKNQDFQKYGEMLQGMTFNDKNAIEGFGRLKQLIEDGTVVRTRLNIDINEPGLHELWWECLRDPPRSMARSRNTPLSRYLPIADSRKPSSDSKLNVLLVISSPEDLGVPGGKWERLPKIDEVEEEQVVREALHGMEDRIDNLFCLTKPASYKRIRRMLLDGNFHILHIIAHGGFSDDKGHVLLEKDDDELADPVNDEELAELVQEISSLQLVILAACHSAERSDANAFVGLAPRVIQAGVPAVIAMQDRVSQQTARTFTKEFYDALLHNEQTMGMVDAAVNTARDMIFSDNRRSWDWAIPVLFMRGEGRLFTSSTIAVRSPTGAISGGPSLPSNVNIYSPQIAGYTVVSQLVTPLPSPGVSDAQSTQRASGTIVAKSPQFDSNMISGGENKFSSNPPASGKEG